MRAWSTVVLLIVCATAASAQDAPPVGILQGELLESEGSPTAGDLSVRALDNRVYRCSYDERTLFERDRSRIAVSSLKAGERIEVVSDRTKSGNRCYARMVHVFEQQPPKFPGYLLRLRVPPRVTESFAPRGNLTFAGVVLRLNTEALVLRTRTGGQETIRLRQDTRYLDSGSAGEAANLQVNTRVYIRAGKNFEDQLEAYQVVWGQIAGPR
jgi:hypothetical protein